MRVARLLLLMSDSLKPAERATALFLFMKNFPRRAVTWKSSTMKNNQNSWMKNHLNPFRVTLLPACWSRAPSNVIAAHRSCESADQRQWKSKKEVLALKLPKLVLRRELNCIIRGSADISMSSGFFAWISRSQLKAADSRLLWKKNYRLRYETRIVSVRLEQELSGESRDMGKKLKL